MDTLSEEVAADTSSDLQVIENHSSTSKYDVTSMQIVTAGMAVFRRLVGDVFPFMQQLRNSRLNNEGAIIKDALSCATWFYVACLNFPEFYLENRTKLLIFLHFMVGDNYDEVVRHFRRLCRIKPIGVQRES